MCGIFGSYNASKFEILDQVNKVRGNFASGLYYHDGKNFDFQRTEGSFDWDDIKLPDGFVFLGHNLAPTSVRKVWNEKTSHPFVVKNWVVAHNGVLTNFEKLKTEYLPNHDNAVDSSIIPALLSHFEETLLLGKANTIDRENQLISYVLQQLEGTFGVWIVNTNTLNVYVARQGSTLFYDKNSFSSAKGEGFVEFEEGKIYKFNKKGFKVTGEFKPNSPFLEL